MATPTARRYVEELESHRSPEEEVKVRRYFKYGGEDTNTPRRSEGRSEGEEEHEDGMRDRRDQRGRLHAPGTDHRPVHRAGAEDRRAREAWTSKTAVVQCTRSRARRSHVAGDQAARLALARRCRRPPWRPAGSTARPSSSRGVAPARNSPLTARSRLR